MHMGYYFLYATFFILSVYFAIYFLILTEVHFFFSLTLLLTSDTTRLLVPMLIVCRCRFCVWRSPVFIMASIHSTHISFASFSSLKKLSLLLICFVLPPTDQPLTKATVPLLSQYIIISFFTFNPINFTNLSTYIISYTQVVIAITSASAVDRATTFCILLFAIKKTPLNKRKRFIYTCNHLMW